MQDSLKILESVNTFYSQSFSQLMTIMVAFLAFAGVIIPILITLYQKRVFSIEQQLIEQKIQKKIKSEIDIELSLVREVYEKKILEVKAEYEKKNAEIVSKIIKMQQQISIDLACAEGGIFHVQGCNELRANGKEVTIATISFINAAEKYIEGKDNLNLQRVLPQIINDCLPHLNKSTLESEGLIESIDRLILKLKNYNTRNAYTDKISDLKQEYKLAKKRLE